MPATKIITGVKMPAGKYWVGDPCYAVPDHRWMEWLESADYMNERRFLLAELDGMPTLGVGTAHGDGQYLGSDGKRYPVDAGLIGVTPAELVEGHPGGMSLVEFENDFLCEYDEDGTITIGHITIDTDPDEDDEDDYYDDEDDD